MEHKRSIIEAKNTTRLRNGYCDTHNIFFSFFSVSFIAIFRLF